MSLLGGVSVARFLREHWQRKPLLVRGAFPAFRDPITANELAGLSCEEGVESRLVRERGGSGPWEVTWGPQDEARLTALPRGGWTLLVQEVNRWVPEAALLLEPFSFVPNVRVDDVMVSFAAPGGSVGPHVDSYDVFLVQGCGSRRWRYHTKPTRDVSIRKNLDLRILSRFEADADEVLGPGDMLYIPPGFAHWGVAESPCLTYSIGFRAPNTAEAWISFATEAAARATRTPLADPVLAPATEPGAIPPALLRRAREMIRSIDLSDDAIDRWYAAFATRLKPGHALEPRRRRVDAVAIRRKLAAGHRIVRSEEARWAFLSRGEGLLLFVGGNEIEVPARAASLARALCARRRHDGRELRKVLGSREARALLERLFAIGALSFDSP